MFEKGTMITPKKVVGLVLTGYAIVILGKITPYNEIILAIALLVAAYFLVIAGRQL